MAHVEFVCPHCSGRFELEDPPAGEHVACPLCRGMLAIPAELPQQDTEEGASDVVEPAPAESLVRRRTPAAHDEAPAVKALSREEKEHRRQIRSLVWMIGGGLLLVIAVAVLSRL